MFAFIIGEAIWFTKNLEMEIGRTRKTLIVI
jgi:hypothetical protein